MKKMEIDHWKKSRKLSNAMYTRLTNILTY
jgi:hypothetical protein